jgi:biotin transport system substrate-specific component
MQYLTRFDDVRSNFFRWRHSASYYHKVVLVFAAAGLTGLCAQARLYTPWSPVPVTMQVFAVLLSGVVLGRWFGGMSQLLYLALGVAGVPWFAPKLGAGAFTNGGAQALLGATGGYLIGFVVASLLVGHLVDSYARSRRLLPQMAVMLLGIGIIYLLGWVHLYLWMSLSCGIDISLLDAIALGVAPFIAFDVAKALIVSGMSTAILPKKRYGAERPVRRLNP